MTVYWIAKYRAVPRFTAVHRLRLCALQNTIFVYCILKTLHTINTFFTSDNNVELERCKMKLRKTENNVMAPTSAETQLS